MTDGLNIEGLSSENEAKMMRALGLDTLNYYGLSIGDDPKAFVRSGGLRAMEREAAKQAIASVRTAAYVLLPDLFALVDVKRVPARIRAELLLDYQRARKGGGFIPKPTPK